MNTETKSYTVELVDSMMTALIEQKQSAGFRKLKNGLFEDCTGQVYSVELAQKKLSNPQGDEIYQVTLKMKPVSLVGAM